MKYLFLYLRVWGWVCKHMPSSLTPGAPCLYTHATDMEVHSLSMFSFVPSSLVLSIFLPLLRLFSHPLPLSLPSLFPGPSRVPGSCFHMAGSAPLRQFRLCGMCLAALGPSPPVLFIPEPADVRVEHPLCTLLHLALLPSNGAPMGSAIAVRSTFFQ